MSRAAIVGLAALIVAAVLGMATLFTVAQTEQALVTEFGKPVRVVADPGLHARIPFVQSVIGFDRRLLSVRTPGEEVILGPFEPGDFGQVAFLHKDGAVLEYLEYTDLDRWYGQATPWMPAGPPDRLAPGVPG